MSDLKKNETVTLGGGCFWCVEAVFKQLKGIIDVKSGYSGGRWPDPSYREVKFGRSGHAEVVQIEFDPQVLPLKDLLMVFFTTHDPTTLNRQGNDKGHQYRSVVFYRDEKQKETVERVMKEMVSYFDDPIVTELTPFSAFYQAEEVHQNYFEENPEQPYCQVIISPKINKLREMYTERLL